MAYDDSEALQPNSTYNLGGYSFDLEVQSVHEPGEEDVVSVFAICHDPDGSRETVPKDFPAGTTVLGWYVETNETEATVYATIKKGGISGVNLPLNTSKISNGDVIVNQQAGELGEWVIKGGSITTACDDNRFIVARSDPHVSNYDAVYKPLVGSGYYDRFNVSTPYTYNGQTVYYNTFVGNVIGTYKNYNLTEQSAKFGNTDKTAWAMVYGGVDNEPEDVIIARFAIDLSEADGGPDGDWDEPGDTGDPSYTLNVSVTGASSGSNSGIPLEAQEQTTYGSGGYGGNGGGGGAGASTVIIYEFATDKAGTVNQEATAQGPGTGGSGGKGGKGGDGCILIFY